MPSCTLEAGGLVSTVTSELVRLAGEGPGRGRARAGWSLGEIPFLGFLYFTIT